jgi:predicted AAA+ superfamily ATPase
MYRDHIEQLVKWKKSKSHKPLVLRGARQVGKTWTLKKFAADNYKSVAYVNLDNNTQMENLFELDFDIERIVNGLEVATGVKITPNQTLIILDEIQEVPKALAALKYFRENAPRYDVAVAGSLLGIALHEGTSFPVGMVDFVDIFPMTFDEFLRAVSQEQLADLLKSGDYQQISVFHEKLVDLMKNYFIVGGMPEVVQNYIDEGNLLQTRDVQRKILAAYEQDFSKHAPVNIVPKIREIFNILPAQLAKENKKFIFKMIRNGARAKDYEDALLWLEDAGIVQRVSRVNNARLPLSVYADNDIFKLFINDIGLLGAKAHLSPDLILDKNKMFVEFRGAMSEQFVFQELRANTVDTYYFANDDSRGEIDFVIDTSQAIVPIEVKSGTSTAARSLPIFVKKYELDLAVKLSLLPYRESGKTVNYPLYAASNLQKV